MTYFQLPNPFMPHPTAPTKESAAMVAKMLKAIEAPAKKQRKAKSMKR